MDELIEKITTDLELRALRWAERERTANMKLCEALHGLLGQWDKRDDPVTEGLVDLEASGAAIRKALAVLAEVE